MYGPLSNRLCERVALCPTVEYAMSCAYCTLAIKDSDVYWELKCKKHLAHGSHGTTRCHICTPIAGDAIQDTASVTNSPAVVPQSTQPHGYIVPWHEQQARLRRLENNAARRTESLKPEEPSAITSFFTGLLQVAGRVAEASEPEDESGNPEVLVDAKVPLKTLVQKHGFDITELIKDHQFTIAHFFRNGYTIGEMADAFSSRMNPTEGMDVLYYLGMTDQFLSDLPQLSQVPIMKAKLGLTVDTLISRLDYKFVPGRWTIPQMIEVGLTMPVVMRQGMRTTEEWAQLRATARNTSDLLQFGETPLLVAQLVRPTVSEPAVETVAQPAPQSGLIYGPIIPKQWPPPGMTVVSSGKTPPATGVVPVSVTKVNTYAWSSKLPADVFATTPPATVDLVSSSVVQPTRVDTTPKLVDRPAPLLILPHHRPAQSAPYSLK